MVPMTLSKGVFSSTVIVYICCSNVGQWLFTSIILIFIVQLAVFKLGLAFRTIAVNVIFEMFFRLSSCFATVTIPELAQ